MEGKQRPLAQAGEEDDTRRGPGGASAWPRTYRGTEGDSPEDRPQEGGQDRTQWARVAAARPDPARNLEGGSWGNHPLGPQTT